MSSHSSLPHSRLSTVLRIRRRIRWSLVLIKVLRMRRKWMHHDKLKSCRKSLRNSRLMMARDLPQLSIRGQDLNLLALRPKSKRKRRTRSLKNQSTLLNLRILQQLKSHLNSRSFGLSFPRQQVARRKRLPSRPRNKQPQPQPLRKRRKSLRSTTFRPSTQLSRRVHPRSRSLRKMQLWSKNPL